MKKLLFALLALITIAIATPVAQAGQFARVYSQHGPVYLHKSQLYGGNYYAGGYSNHGYRRSSHRRHHSRSYYSRSGYYSRSNYYSRSSNSHCRPHYGYRSSPRVSVSFGF
jgi:hypothetical protein